MTIQRKSKRLQASESKAFKRQKFTWLGWVKDFIKAHELPPSAYLYAAHYSDKFNEERGGMAWEGCGETAQSHRHEQVKRGAAPSSLRRVGPVRCRVGQAGQGSFNAVLDGSKRCTGAPFQRGQACKKVHLSTKKVHQCK